MISREILIIVSAFLLDGLLGDPRWFPHPVSLMAGWAGYLETLTRRWFSSPGLAGLVTVFWVLLLTFWLGWLFLSAGVWLGPEPGLIAAIIMLYFCLAVRGLAAHARAVRLALEDGDLPLARLKVAMMVGRDTEDLDEEGIIRAGVESVAENIVDGVIAPLFYGVIGGPLAALVYKAVNTMDSLFGYKNERYREFGRAAARLDDLFNLIPARLSGLLIVVAAAVLGLDGRGAWRILWRDRLNHASPNSGYPEAAVAGALGIALGGISSYAGRPMVKPVLGESLIRLKPDHLKLVNRLLYVSTVLALFLLVAVRMMAV